MEHFQDHKNTNDKPISNHDVMIMDEINQNQLSEVPQPQLMFKMSREGDKAS